MERPTPVVLYKNSTSVIRKRDAFVYDYYPMTLVSLDLLASKIEHRGKELDRIGRGYDVVYMAKKRNKKLTQVLIRNMFRPWGYELQGEFAEIVRYDFPEFKDNEYKYLHYTHILVQKKGRKKYSTRWMLNTFELEWWIE